MSPKLPRIFVASSTEQLKIAYAIQELLEFDGEVTVWTEGTFKASSYTLDDLPTSIQSHQFGVFVFVSDDRVTMRGQSWPAVRDNLVFEFGLFIGARGRQNCFCPVRTLWPEIHTALAPPNHADEWWDPPPKIAELYGRWTQSP